MQLRLVMLSAVLAGAAWGADPFAGEWKLSVKDSKYAPGAAPAEAVMTQEPEGKGVRVTTSGVRGNGSPFKESYVAFFDGVERPSKGPWNFDAVVNSQLSERERRATFKRDGKVVGTLSVTVSPDGTRLTETVRFGEEMSVRVYLRR